MIQLFLSRGKHDVCFVSFVSSFSNQCYKPWPLSQLADTTVYINKLKHLNSIVLSTYWSLNVLDRKKKRFCGWWVNQNAWKTSLQQIRNFSYSPIHVIRVIRYRRNTPLSSPLQQLIGLYFFSLVWKNKRKCWCRLVNRCNQKPGQREMKQTTKTYHTIHLVMGTRSLKLKLRMRYIIQQ